MLVGRLGSIIFWTFFHSLWVVAEILAENIDESLWARFSEELSVSTLPEEWRALVLVGEVHVSKHVAVDSFVAIVEFLGGDYPVVSLVCW